MPKKKPPEAKASPTKDTAGAAQGPAPGKKATRPRPTFQERIKQAESQSPGAVLAVVFYGNSRKARELREVAAQIEDRAHRVDLEDRQAMARYLWDVGRACHKSTKRLRVPLAMIRMVAERFLIKQGRAEGVGPLLFDYVARAVQDAQAAGYFKESGTGTGAGCWPAGPLVEIAEAGPRQTPATDAEEPAPTGTPRLPDEIIESLRTAMAMGFHEWGQGYPTPEQEREAVNREWGVPSKDTDKELQRGLEDLGTEIHVLHAIEAGKKAGPLAPHRQAVAQAVGLTLTALGYRDRCLPMVEAAIRRLIERRWVDVKGNGLAITGTGAEALKNAKVDPATGFYETTAPGPQEEAVIQAPAEAGPISILEFLRTQNRGTGAQAKRAKESFEKWMDRNGKRPEPVSAGRPARRGRRARANLYEYGTLESIWRQYCRLD